MLFELEVILGIYFRVKRNPHRALLQNQILNHQKKMEYKAQWWILEQRNNNQNNGKILLKRSFRFVLSI